MANERCSEVHRHAPLRHHDIHCQPLAQIRPSKNSKAFFIAAGSAKYMNKWMRAISFAPQWFEREEVAQLRKGEKRGLAETQ